MDKEKAAADIISHALPLVPFDGWTQATLNKAAVAAGYKRTDAIRVFPEGVNQALDFYFADSDRKMLAKLARYNLDTMKIRERVATSVRLWIETHAASKEALRRALALQSLPFYKIHALKNLYNTVDNIWYAIGDKSTDYNFYTKRLMLAAVFSSTVTYWLDDKSAGYENSWAFLNRRIENVMSIEKAKSKLKKILENPADFFRRSA